MKVWIVFETYEMQPRVFADEESARIAVAEILREYRDGGWRVHTDTRGSEWSVSCEQEGHYDIYLDVRDVERVRRRHTVHVRYLCDDSVYAERSTFGSVSEARAYVRELEDAWRSNRPGGHAEDVFRSARDIMVRCPGWNNEALHVRITRDGEAAD